MKTTTDKAAELRNELKADEEPENVDELAEQLFERGEILAALKRAQGTGTGFVTSKQIRNRLRRRCPMSTDQVKMRLDQLADDGLAESLWDCGWWNYRLVAEALPAEPTKLEKAQIVVQALYTLPVPANSEGDSVTARAVRQNARKKTEHLDDLYQTALRVIERAARRDNDEPVTILAGDWEPGHKIPPQPVAEKVADAIAAGARSITEIAERAGVAASDADLGIKELQHNGRFDYGLNADGSIYRLAR